jgi:hypothetical protein
MRPLVVVVMTCFAGKALAQESPQAATAIDTAIDRGLKFLAQDAIEWKVNGSWHMTSRPTKPGAEGSSSSIPIVAGGSAWAVLGLVRSF